MRYLYLILLALVGCRSGASTARIDEPHSLPVAYDGYADDVQTASHDGSPSENDASTPPSESVAPNDAVEEQTVQLISATAQDQRPEITWESVITSVHQTFPLVQAVFQERGIANGNQMAAWGEFDTKIKAASENGPLGFYETYRNSAGFTNPLYGGGEVFGGYRNGGGSFQPWYLERETNHGGEFKGGVRVPLIRNRDIDARRAALWRATYDQQIADPTIRLALIMFSRDAGLAYWKWVASGQKYRLGEQWLALAQDRHEGIKRQVELENLGMPEETDNLRAIAKREAKLADSLRVLQMSAAKLSLFWRDTAGQPIVPSIDDIPDFPPLRVIDDERLYSDIVLAQQNRPELTTLNLQLQQLRVDYSEACNMTLPALDAQLVGSQDMGEPTSKKRDKSEFELEAGLFFDVPLQRRKGRGKMFAIQAKMSQVTAKQRIVQDKIAVDVKAAYAALKLSRLEALKAQQARELASQMADIERRKFELGESDLLYVVLREQYALEAAEELVSANFNHFVALTEYAAALAIDRPTIDMLMEDAE